VLRRRARDAGQLTAVAIEELPPETWSHEAWLLADVHDAIAVQAWQFACAHTPENKPRPPQPPPLPRPIGIPRRRSTLNAWFTAASAGPPTSPDP